MPCSYGKVNENPPVVADVCMACEECWGPPALSRSHDGPGLGKCPRHCGDPDDWFLCPHRLAQCVHLGDLRDDLFADDLDGTQDGLLGLYDES
jgi:hypothetical protein